MTVKRNARVGDDITEICDLPTRTVVVDTTTDIAYQYQADGNYPWLAPGGWYFSWRELLDPRDREDRPRIRVVYLPEPAGDVYEGW